MPAGWLQLVSPLLPPELLWPGWKKRHPPKAPKNRAGPGPALRGARAPANNSTSPTVKSLSDPCNRGRLFLRCRRLSKQPGGLPSVSKTVALPDAVQHLDSAHAFSAVALRASSTALNSACFASWDESNATSTHKALLANAPSFCIVNPKKLETGLRTNSAGIPYTLLFFLRAFF